MLLVKAWRFMTVSAVIRRLHNMISQSEYYEHIYDTNDRCGGEVENGNTDNQMTLEAGKRDDIFLSIDAIMNRVNIPIWNEHDYIINNGGVGIMLYLLRKFSDDEEMVIKIFQVFDILMKGEREKNDITDQRIVGISEQCQIEQLRKKNRTTAHFNNIGTNGFYRTAKLILHLRGKELISHLINAYQHRNDNIRFMGRSILKDLIIAESDVTVEILCQIEKAVEANVSFETYSIINPKIQELFSRNEMTMNETPAVDHGIQINSPGNAAIHIVVQSMIKFPENVRIQFLGLDVLLKYVDRRINQVKTIRQDSDESNQIDYNEMIVNEECIIAVLSVLKSTEFAIRWRAYYLLMELTSCYSKVCEIVNDNGGCDTLVKALGHFSISTSKEEVDNDDNNDKSISELQLVLWTLANLCETETCRHKLVQLGLRSILQTVPQKDKDDNDVVIPLSLLALMQQTALEHVSRFKIEDETVTVPPSTSCKTPYIILPTLVQKKPVYGTTNELFCAGQPGLI